MNITQKIWALIGRDPNKWPAWMHERVLDLYGVKLKQDRRGNLMPVFPEVETIVPECPSSLSKEFVEMSNEYS